MFRKFFLPIVFSFFMLLFFAPAGAQNVSVKALVDKNSVSMGEPFTFQIQVEGADTTATPDTSVITDFQVEYLGGQNNSQSSITIINGKMSRQESHGYVHSYRLTPLKTGQFFIPSVPVPLGPQTLRTQPILIKVAQPEATDDFKLSLKLSKTSFYVGEPVILTVTWYISKNVQDFAFRLPILDNKAFTFEDPKVNQEPSKEYFRVPLGRTFATAEKGVEVLNGRQYTTLSFRKALTARDGGTFHIPESTVSCNALMGYAQGDNTGRDPFGRILNDDFFGFGRKKVFKTFVAKSEPLVLKVMDLPIEGKPADFSGLVGQYQVEASATPTDVNVGDPITLTLSVSGSQYLERLEISSLARDPEFSGAFKIPDEMAAGVVKDGAKLFTQTLRAQSDQVKEIPPFKLSYFDPERREYRVAQSEPIPLKVKATRVVTAADAEGQSPTAPVKNELEVWAQGIAYNYEGPDVLENQNFTGSSFVRSPLWIAALIVPFLIYIFLFIFVQLRQRRTADPAAYRSRKALSVFRQKIKEMADVPEAKSEAYADLLNAVRQYLGNKLKMNGAAMTFADIEEPLRAQEIDAEILSRLKEIFTLCEQGRYGGSVHPGQSFDELIRMAQEAIQSLDRNI